MLFQNFARYWFTVDENVALSRIDRLGEKRHISDALGRADAQSLVDKLPRK